MKNDHDYFKSNTSKIPIARHIFTHALDLYVKDRLRWNGKDVANFDISCDIHTICKSCGKPYLECTCEESKLRV